MTHAGYFFFFNNAATTEIYPLSLHDALPISRASFANRSGSGDQGTMSMRSPFSSFTTACTREPLRSEEHTSELQSQSNLVCRLLLEKKKKIEKNPVCCVVGCIVSSEVHRGRH